MGNWRGGYGDGTNPCAWRSSVEIMRKYANNKCPVKYGQCWVFGAILCTGDETIISFECCQPTTTTNCV